MSGSVNTGTFCELVVNNLGLSIASHSSELSLAIRLGVGSTSKSWD